MKVIRINLTKENKANYGKFVKGAAMVRCKGDVHLPLVR